jgi:hypothetical protein
LSGDRFPVRGVHLHNVFSDEYFNEFGRQQAVLQASQYPFQDAVAQHCATIVAHTPLAAIGTPKGKRPVSPALLT